MSEQNVESVVSGISDVAQDVELENPPPWSTPTVTVLSVADLTEAGVGVGGDAFCAS